MKRKGGGGRGYFGAIYSKMSFFPIQQIRLKNIASERRGVGSNKLKNIYPYIIYPYF